MSCEPQCVGDSRERCMAGKAGRCVDSEKRRCKRLLCLPEGQLQCCDETIMHSLAEQAVVVKAFQLVPYRAENLPQSS